MQKLKHNIKLFSQKGFTLIEALVVLSIFSIILVTFYSTFTLGTQYIIDAKNRLGAVSLANQKMEIVRNLQYDDIGTLTGVPQGVLDDDYYENVNAVSYHVKTDISFVDDDFDGIEGVDVVATDYKTVRISILWGDEAASRQVFLLSDFVPPGIETNIGGGTLRVNVIDTPANGLSDVAVNISSVSNGINISTSTDSSGTVLRPGMPAGNDYVISVSKENYESITTLPLSPDSDYDPVADQNASVIEGSLNIKSIIIDLLANINIATEDLFGNPIPNISFNLSGGRLVGNNISEGMPGALEYNYNEDLSTDLNGEKNIDDVSPGSYVFTLPDEIEGYEFYEMIPNDDIDSDTFVADPGSDIGVKAILMDESFDSLFVSVSDIDSGTAVEGAEVHLVNNLLGYDVSLTTDKFGKVYFPQNETPLAKDSYELSVSADGFNDDNSTISIDGLNMSYIQLTPQ